VIGDGLDDLIVGVDQAYVNGKQRVGKSYVSNHPSHHR
jgi:hypothetical protein